MNHSLANTLLLSEIQQLGEQIAGEAIQAAMVVKEKVPVSSRKEWLESKLGIRGTDHGFSLHQLEMLFLEQKRQCLHRLVEVLNVTIKGEAA